MKISGQNDAERCWKISGAPEVRAQLCARANTHQVKAFDQGLCTEGKVRRLEKKWTIDTGWGPQDSVQLPYFSGFMVGITIVNRAYNGL